MILLRLISWPYVKKHALRAALTTAGIVLGIAVFVGMNTANRSVLLAFAHTVDRIAGKTQLQVSAGEVGFPEEVLDTVQGSPAVEVAVPVIESVADTSIRGQGSLLILGVDMTGDRRLREYDLESGDEAVVDDPLVFLAQPDSLIVSESFAAANGVTTGAAIPLRTGEGEKRFTVRGIMKSGGLASAFGGNLAVMDIYAAQKMFGRGRMFDRIDLALRPGYSIADGQRDLQSRLGAGFQVETPATRGQHFEAMIAAYSVMATASSLFALFIGMFIIYNAFAIAVTERRKEIGILRALGATRGQVRSLFLVEGAVAGLVGSSLGLLLGVVLARGIALAMGTLVRSVSDLGRHQGIVTSPALLAGALAIGVATSVMAALLPARTAARVDPVRALQKGRYQMLSAGETRLRVLAATLFTAASAACLAIGGGRAVFYASYLFMILVAVLVCPWLCLWLARGLRPLLRWARPVEGTLAADSLVQAPRRTSASVAALMLSLALVVAFAGMARSSFASIEDWVDSVLNPDLFVIPSHEVTTRTIRFPASMAGELAAIPGVRRVQMVRQARIHFRGTPVMLMALELASTAQTTSLKPVDGDPAEMFRAASAGEAVLVSDNLAELQGLARGQSLELPTPGGTVTLPIAGVVVDYIDQRGVIVIDRRLFTRYWRDDSVNVFRVYLAPGAPLAEVKRQILERYAGQRQVFVLNNDEMKGFILRIAGQWFALTYVQIGVAVLVAILGIVNTLTVSITDRRRELGVLRAVGALKGQVRRTIWMEALGIGALGIALGVALGAVNLYYLLEIVRRDVIGMRFSYRFPAAVALGVAPVMLAVAFVAALWPATLAGRGSLVEALEYE
jgi:putative ABC transport system permease protein